MLRRAMFVFGLTVGGESVSFEDLRILEATAKDDWPATKAKLAAKSAE